MVTTQAATAPEGVIIIWVSLSRDPELRDAENCLHGHYLDLV